MKKEILIILFLVSLVILTGCEQEAKEEIQTVQESAAPQTQTIIQEETQIQEPAIIQTEPEGKLAKDEIDTIPDISISECLTQIKQTNPEMSDQDANDNCWTIEAVNKNDVSLCDKVSASLKDICLMQFE